MLWQQLTSGPRLTPMPLSARTSNGPLPILQLAQSSNITQLLAAKCCSFKSSGSFILAECPGLSLIGSTNDVKIQCNIQNTRDDILPKKHFKHSVVQCVGNLSAMQQKEIGQESGICNAALINIATLQRSGLDCELYIGNRRTQRCRASSSKAVQCCKNTSLRSFPCTLHGS